MSKLTSAPQAHLGEFPGPSKPWFSYLKRDKAGIRRLLLLELTEITGELASLGPTTHRSLRGPGRPPTARPLGPVAWPSRALTTDLCCQRTRVRSLKSFLSPLASVNACILAEKRTGRGKEARVTVPAPRGLQATQPRATVM